MEMQILKANKYTINVLMATYNGEKYVSEQIDTILAQKGVTVNLYIRDDGSTDKTVKIIERYKSNYSNVFLYTGKNLGVANNFFELLNQCSKSEFYAFADQDDIWDDDKILTAVSMLSKVDKKSPALYCCNSRHVDRYGNPFGTEGVMKTTRTLGSALIYSNAQGSTMVFNDSLANLLKEYTPNFSDLNILHDAWVHKVCLSVGGTVIIDKNAHMSYRIHGENVVAKAPTKRTLFAKLKHLFDVERPYYCSKVATTIYNAYSQEIPSTNKFLIEMIANYRNSRWLRMKLLFSNKIKTHVFKIDINFKYRVIIGKA
jgi:glycosyltransferase involved in cell wall biosynthesis